MPKVEGGHWPAPLQFSATEEAELTIHFIPFFNGLGYLVITILLGEMYDGDGGLDESDDLPSPSSTRTIAAAATGFGEG